MFSQVHSHLLKFLNISNTDTVKTQTGERCKFWQLHEHLTAALDLQLFCWAAAKFGSSYSTMTDRGWRALTLNGIPCCCLRCCRLGWSLDRIFLLWTCRCIRTTCHVCALEESRRRINKAEKLSFFKKKNKNLWMPSAPSGGHHGQQNHIFASVVTLLSTVHEWLWNWPFYWIWWSITAQMEVWLPQGTGDIA